MFVIEAFFTKATPYGIIGFRPVDFIKYYILHTHSAHKSVSTANFEECRTSYLIILHLLISFKILTNEPVAAAAVDTSVWPLLKMLSASI